LIRRDATATPPALNGRDVPVPQGASERADAAEQANDPLCGLSHTQFVRFLRGGVNVESVERFGADGFMANEPSEPVTAKLKKLRERSGFSLDFMAHEMDYAGASSIQRYEDPDLYTKPYLSLSLVEKLAKVLVGQGKPPIAREEVFALAGKPSEGDAEESEPPSDLELEAYDLIETLTVGKLKKWIRDGKELRDAPQPAPSTGAALPFKPPKSSRSNHQS
jgi:hypothetical protein